MMGDDDDIDGCGDRKGILLWLEPIDQAIIAKIKRRHGGSTTSAAIRACIRIADEVALELKHVPPTNDD
jgi:hypothetical protein